MKATITALCELRTADRVVAKDVFHWLKKFKREIGLLEPFECGMPPLKESKRATNSKR